MNCLSKWQVLALEYNMGRYGIEMLFSDTQPSNVDLPISLNASDKVTFVSVVQSLKVLLPIVVTLSGIEMLFSDTHPSNIPSPRFFKLSDNLTSESEVQFLNSEPPLFVTLSGMEMLLKDVQSWNIRCAKNLS